MQIIFGRSGYAYSHSLTYSGNKYLPFMAFMDSKRNLASEIGVSTPCNCKDEPMPKVNNLIDCDGSLISKVMLGAKSAKNNPTDIKAGFIDYKPNRDDCVLAIADNKVCGVVYFAWLTIDKEIASLNNGDTFNLGYYTSPFTCHPSIVSMRVFHNYADAVAHVRKHVAELEAIIKPMVIDQEAEHQMIEDTKKKLQF